MEPLQAVLIRLADEGMPVCAIARSVQLASANVRSALAEAQEEGRLLDMPRDDWPPNVERHSRLPAFLRSGQDEEALILHIVNHFDVQRMGAVLLLQFIKRGTCNREQLHLAMKARGRDRNAKTSPKIVDVVICALRERLKLVLGVDPKKVIVTVWCCGYTMPYVYRRKMAAILGRLIGHPLRAA